MTYDRFAKGQKTKDYYSYMLLDALQKHNIVDTLKMDHSEVI